MKKASALILMIFLVFNIGYCQKKISKLDSISFSQLDEINQSKDYRNIVTIKNYKTSLGNWLSIGDTLIIGKPSNANALNRTALQGSVNTHTHIVLGTTGSAMMGGLMMANQGMTGDEAVIIGIKMGRISKRQPFDVNVELNKADGVRFMGSKKLARALLESALTSGELIDPNAAMTREEAIAKLKEAKELLDLEMMTQEEYDKLKDELAPIIRSKNNP